MFPDFLCIGAQKSGTTWLHHNLGRHPEIFLPPLKELHYFDRQSDGLYARLTQNQENYKAVRREIKSEIIELKCLRDSSKLAWLARYLLLPRSDKWYASLFPDSGNCVCGEITPAYALMDDAVLQQISQQLPSVKIIYLVRNPILRAWSAINMNAQGKGICLETTPDQDIIAMFTNNNLYRQHSDFLAILDRWLQYFDRNQIFVGFFEQLKDSPVALLNDVFSFLGVESENFVFPVNLSKARNTTGSVGIPESVKSVVTEYYYDDFVALHRRFGNEYTAKWLSDAEDQLAVGANSKTEGYRRKAG